MRTRLLFRCSTIAALTLAFLPVVAGYQQPARGLAQNVRAEARADGVTITYDLIAEDPRSVFAATLEVSTDEGKTYEAVRSGVTGDVGAAVTPGLSKRIAWQPGPEMKGRDLAKAAYRIALAASGDAAKPAAPAGAIGSVVVATIPSGASVFLNGTIKGETPLTISDLKPGKYEIRVSKDGYLENRREISVAAGGPETVTITMTGATAAAAGGTTPAAAATTQPGVSSGGGGGNPLKWILPVAGGGGAAAYFLTKKDSEPPIVQQQPACTSASASTTSLPAFPASGASTTVSVTVGPSGCVGSVNWTASSGTASWIAISPTSGSGSATVTLTAAANTGGSRSGTITVAGTGIAVSQNANPCTFTVRMRQGTNNTDGVGAGGGNREVDITASAATCTWTATPDVTWITANPTSGTGNRSGTTPVVLTAARNTTGAARTGRVTIAGVVITLNQAAS